MTGACRVWRVGVPHACIHLYTSPLLLKSHKPFACFGVLGVFVFTQHESDRSAQWEAQQQDLCDNWAVGWQHVRRVELHIPSISSPLEVRRRMPNRRLREGGQLSRLCAVADPLVEVVYVSPCVLPETVMAYYRKMIEVGRLCPWGALFWIPGCV